MLYSPKYKKFLGNLEDFSFSAVEATPAFREFVRTAVDGPWRLPMVRKLRFDYFRLGSDQMSPLLNRTEQCQVWEAPYAQLQAESFYDLSKHFLTLVEIDLGASQDVKSTMMQKILESCPSHATLRGSKIYLIDISSGEPWIS
ncbi:hypothetical protein BGX27_000351, partial [Mortierella sp. AM989]